MFTIGKDKCVKMHIGKKHNTEICPQVKIDSWKDTPVKNSEGKYELKDIYDGKEDMKDVEDKKYLGSIISNDMKNTINIKEKTDKGIGIVNKIVSSISERPYGRYSYQAAVIMREACWINAKQ